MLDAGAHFGDEVIGSILPIRACERADHESMLRLHCVEQIDQRGEGGREVEETKGVPGRGRVDDDSIVRRRLRQRAQSQHGEYFVRPGQRGVHQAGYVVEVEVRAAVDDRDDRFAPLSQEALPLDGGGDLKRVQGAGDSSDRSRVVTQVGAERLAERASRIGREQKRS